MDDLLDLSWSDTSTPAKGAGGTTPILQPTARAGSSFDALAKPTTAVNYASLSSSSTRTSSPLSNGLNATSRVESRIASPAVRTPASGAASPAPRASNDAFSSLLSGASAVSGNKNLTMAERSAQLAAEKKAREEAEKSKWDHGGAFWDKLEGGSTKPVPKAVTSLLSPSPQPASAVPPQRARATPSPGPASAQPKSSSGAFWDSTTLQPAPSAPAARSSSVSPANGSKDAFDDLDGLLTSNKSTPGRGPSPATSAPADPWDLDALSAAVPSNTRPAEEDDDDLLGLLGKPAKSSPKRHSPAPASPRPHAPSRVDSPPPHIVGQIVEMGFSPAQARTALAATWTGLDVQAALDSLLGPQGSREDNGREDEEIDDEQIAREMQAREDRRARHAARRGDPTRESVRPRDDADADDFGVQADRVMAQASEIGASMLSKATSLWNSGKEKAMKAYEEQRRAMDAQAAQKKKPADGRPRWMVEAEEEGEPSRPRVERNGRDGGFRDEDMPPRSPPKPRPQRQANPPPPSNKERVANLFADEPRTYVSKNRHLGRRGAGSGTASPARAPTPRAPTPLITRQLVPATSAQTSSAAQHRVKGNEHFKLGRYAEAEGAYTTAIGALPAGHIHLVTLHNNRAATRLKLGEAGSAISDCSTAIELVGADYHPSKEAPLPSDVDVKLGDALVKATVKRAQAYEMGEKWKLALEDWERVLGFDAALGGSGSKSQASEGVRRAKRMLEGGDKPAPKPKPAPARPQKTVDISRSAAVAGMRAVAAAAEKEDEERLQYQDAVDAKLSAWRTGKETNLRALIASLDTVLWDEILSGGLKVGMHELITDKQVKIKYMKVVARLHPDKLRAGSTTVEQRMLANGAFGTLSEAWAAFNA